MIILFFFQSLKFVYFKDAIEQEINNMSLEPSCEQVDQKSDSILTATDSIENKQRVSELQKEIEDFPPNWNFSMKIAESQYRPPVEIPAEDTGHGANRWVYFVTTDLLGEWIELPPVTPHQINVSRRIKKYLTGNLNKEIVSYPEFPGTERNYLRALITRISASTSIAPRNFFHTGSLGGEEEDFDDEEAVIGKFEIKSIELLESIN